MRIHLYKYLQQEITRVIEWYSTALKMLFSHIDVYPHHHSRLDVIKFLVICHGVQCTCIPLLSTQYATLSVLPTCTYLCDLPRQSPYKHTAVPRYSVEVLAVLGESYLGHNLWQGKRITNDQLCTSTCTWHH